MYCFIVKIKYNLFIFTLHVTWCLSQDLVAPTCGICMTQEELGCGLAVRKASILKKKSFEILATNKYPVMF